MRMERLLQGRGSDGGFTLVEVMIVVAMVAILATASVPFCSGYVKTAKLAEGIAGCGTIRTALQVQRVRNNGNYPVLSNASGDALEALGLNPGDLDGKTFKGYSYNVSSTENSYIISVDYEGETYSINHHGEEIGDITIQ